MVLGPFGFSSYLGFSALGLGVWGAGFIVEAWGLGFRLDTAPHSERAGKYLCYNDV